MENCVSCQRIEISIHLLNRDFDQASNVLEDLISNGNLGASGDFGFFLSDQLLAYFVYIRTGNEMKAEEFRRSWVNKIDSHNLKDHSLKVFFNLSAYYSIGGDRDSAIKYLTKVSDIGLFAGWHDLIEIHPVFENLWADPEFKAIVKRVKETKTSTREKVLELEEQGEFITW